MIGRAVLLVALAGGLLAAAALVIWPRASSSPAAAAATAPAAVPVVVASALRQDVPLYARGVGTVEPLHDVLVRPQIGGILVEVAFEEGQQVEAGQLLARIDDRTTRAELARAAAEVGRAKAQLESARRDLARYRELAATAAVSRQQEEQQAIRVAELEAAVEAAEAARAAFEVQLSYTRILAPISGRTGLRRIDPGNLVQAGDADGIVRVTQTAPIAVLFSLPQEELPAIRALLAAGRPAPVRAYARADGALLGEGALATVDNAVDDATGTVRLKAEFPNDDGALWPGQFVAVELELGVRQAVVTVPERAIQRGRDGAYVYRVTGETVEAVPVAVGETESGLTIVSHGLEAGDRVVVDGQSRLQPGARVAIRTDVAPAGTATAERAP